MKKRCPRILYAGGSAVAVTLAVLIVLEDRETASLYPQTVEITARPGAVALVPFRRRVEGGPKRALGAIEAKPIFNPRPLPQGAKRLHSSLFLIGDAVLGEVLILLPPATSGEIEFSMAASGQGRGQTGSRVFFKTGKTDVTVKVTGSPPANEPPPLVGVWRGDGKLWTFEAGAVPILRIQYPGGETKVMRYRPFPDSNGRWFLIEPYPTGAAYWVSLESGTLSLAHPGTDFKPFATLSRMMP